MIARISDIDPQIAEALENELSRERNTLELIASENFTSTAVLATQGFVFTNKYAEGYPGRRYYGGCEFMDVAEDLARKRACALFDADHANVQPHAGAQANMAAYYALLDIGDTVMGMNLAHGGHLTHGSPVNFSGRWYRIVPYGVDQKTEQIDYDEVRDIARRERPRLLLAGGSAYPRIIDFATMAEIAREVDAYFVVDMAHFAGLVAGGVHPNPVPFADVVTTTTHKTLRGPRGGIILCTETHATAIDKAVFPGIQGGPLMHVIAAKAVALKEAMSDEFKTYASQVVENAAMMAQALADHGVRIVSGGTDTHLFLCDLTSLGITGKDAQEALEAVGITVNRNAIPFDTQPPFVASGIRIGTPALTTRGMGVEEMREIAALIHQVLSNIGDATVASDANRRVRALCDAFPLYEELALP